VKLANFGGGVWPATDNAAIETRPASRATNLRIACRYRFFVAKWRRLRRRLMLGLPGARHWTDSVDQQFKDALELALELGERQL
jgi:hypothetical protein